MLCAKTTNTLAIVNNTQNHDHKKSALSSSKTATVESAEISSSVLITTNHSCNWWNLKRSGNANAKELGEA